MSLLPTDADISHPRMSLWRRWTQLPSLTGTFVILNLLDLGLTLFLLTSGSFREANGIAEYFLDRWGMAGLTTYKVALVLAVVAIAWWVAQYRTRAARWLLIFGCLKIGSVVLYSLYLYLAYGGNGLDEMLSDGRAGVAW
jgi:hypothetical protein